VIGGCEVKGFAADTAAATTPIRVHLKLVPLPRRSALPFAPLPSVSEIPFPRLCGFVVKVLREAENEGTLRAFRNAHRFTTFKIFRRPASLR
jgi:hypothetical protein